MFKNTVAACHIIAKEIRIFARVATSLYTIFMIAYLLYSAIVNDITIKYVLAAIIGMSYLANLFLGSKKSKEAQTVKNNIRHLSAFAKLVLNAVSLATILYAIQTAPDTVGRLQAIVLPLLILVWILQLLLELCSLYIESRLTLLIDGLEMDFEPAIKAKIFVHNAFGGNDPKLHISDHNRKMIENQVIEDLNEKKEAKQHK